MSSRSGITASPEIIASFNKADAPVLVVTLSSDQIQLIHDSDFSTPTLTDTRAILLALQTHFSGCFPEPRYALFIEGSGDPIFISFVPDEAPVRMKMLFASTKNTFLQQLGRGIAKNHTLSFTDIRDLDYDSFRAAIHHSYSSVSLTEQEKDLQVIDNLLNLSLSQNNQLQSMAAATCSSLFFKIDQELDAVLKSNLTSKLVLMSIDTEAEVLQLRAQEDNIVVTDLVSAAQRLVGLDPVPVYILYGYSGSHLAFIYSCASGSKVKARMLYAANKNGLLSYFKADYFKGGELDRVFEVGDLDEMELSSLEPQALKKVVVRNNRLHFSKPKGPRRH